MPLVALSVAILAVSTSAPLVHWAKPAPALTVAASRICLAALLLAIASGRDLRVLRALTRRQLAAIAGAGTLLAAHFAVWITSLYLTSTAASVALVATQPVFAAIIAWFALGDRVRRREIFGIVIAAVGCALLAGGDLGGDALLGDGLALLGALTAAAYLVVGRGVRESLPLFPYLAAVNAVAGALLLVTAVIAGVDFAGFPADTYVAIALCALVPSLIGHTLLNYCVRRVPVHLVSLGILGEPIGAALLALAFFDEVPPATAVIGGAVILAGIAVGFVRFRDRRAVGAGRRWWRPRRR